MKKLSKERVRKEIEEFMRINGLEDFPTKVMFRNFPDGNKLERRIYTAFEEINNARKEMGYPINYRCGEFSLRHWKNLEKEIRVIMKKKKLKNFPVSSQLPSYTLAAAEIHHGGIPAIREKMGFPPGKKTGKRCLMHWSNLEKAMEKVILELGSIPVKANLERMKRYDLACALRRHWNNLEFAQLKEIRSQLKENGLGMEILRIIWKRKIVWIADIYKQLKKEGVYKELDALEIADVIGELNKIGLLEYKDGKYIARG